MDIVKLTKAEFTSIWNARCELSSFISAMEEVLADDLVNKLRIVEHNIHKSIMPAMRVLDRESERRTEHYQKAGDGFNARTVWSMYDVKDLNDEHPFTGASIMSYCDRAYDINCRTWLDLWKVADQLITDSGDGHHIYIEGFNLSKAGELEVMTGS